MKEEIGDKSYIYIIDNASIIKIILIRLLMRLRKWLY